MRLLGRANWYAPRPLRGLYARYGIKESDAEGGPAAVAGRPAGPAAAPAGSAAAAGQAAAVPRPAALAVPVAQDANPGPAARV